MRLLAGPRVAAAAIAGGLALVPAGAGNGGVAPDRAGSGAAVVARPTPPRARLAYACLGSVCVSRVDGTGRRILLRYSNRYFYAEPAWRPRARQIAYEKWDTRSDLHDLALVSLSGARLRTLLTGADYLSDPSWSPDGSRIAVLRGVNPRDLYVVAADGRQNTRLVMDCFCPFSWSPDSERIAYAREFAESVKWDIFIVSAGGGEPRQLTRTPNVSERSPQWLHDGRRIVFVRANALWVISASGVGTAKRLVAARGTYATSPVSAKIAFACGRRGRSICT